MQTDGTSETVDRDAVRQYLAQQLFGYRWLRRSVSVTRWLGPVSEVGDHDDLWGTVRECRPDEMDECEAEELDLPDWTGHDHQAVVEAMRQRGWLITIRWIPDNVPNYGTPEPHKMMPRCTCVVEWWGHHQLPRNDDRWLRRDGFASGSDEGLVVALAVTDALEHEYEESGLGAPRQTGVDGDAV